MAYHSPMDTLLLVLIVGGALLWLVGYMKTRRQERQRAELQAKADGLTDQARRYIEALNASRTYPTVDMFGVNAQKGEFGLLHESSTLYELKPYRVGGAAGTRLKLGKVPIYLGGFESHSLEDWSLAARGDLYLTNKRIVFTGDARSASIALTDMIALDTELDAVRIHTAKRQKPYLFAVGNSILWSLLAKIAASGEVTSPRLPDGLQLGFSAPKAGGQLEIRIAPQST